jgi:hypothetical protein
MLGVIQADSAGNADAIRSDIASLRTRINTHHSSMEQSKFARLNLAIRMQVLQLPIAEELRQKIHLWFNPSDSSSNKAFHLDKRQANSGTWFLDGSDYRKWKTAGYNFSFLWLNGGSMSYISSVQPGISLIWL